MTDRTGSERAPPFSRLLPGSWRAEAHRLLVSPADELTAPELAAARKLARAVGRCASDFVREGASGANPHGIEPDSAAGAYVRFVVAVLHDLGPAASCELEHWKGRLYGDEPLNDPRLEAFRQGYERPLGEAAVEEGAGTLRHGPGVAPHPAFATGLPQTVETGIEEVTTAESGPGDRRRD